MINVQHTCVNDEVNGLFTDEASSALRLIEGLTQRVHFRAIQPAEVL